MSRDGCCPQFAYDRRAHPPVARPTEFLPRLAELVEPPCGPHPDLDSVGFQVAVLCLSRVVSHRDCNVADVLDLIDGFRFGQRLAGCIVMKQGRGFFACLRPPAALPICGGLIALSHPCPFRQAGISLLAQRQK
jgi:hypothetical protein